MADPEFVNIHTGTTVDYINGGAGKGVDYMEEYTFFDKAVSGRKQVWIRDTTQIVMYLNEFNNVAVTTFPNSSTQRFYAAITQNGMDGVANSGDEGAIRFYPDRDGQYDKYEWSEWYLELGGRSAFPLYTGPFTFASLNYGPDAPSTPVVGTTGSNGVDPSDNVNYYWRGMIDSVGDEWHTLTVGHDDTAMFSGKAELQSSDGRIWLFCVNPKTPGMTIRVTGNAQFYTTPAKTYWRPAILDQITYMTPGTGTVTFELRNIYGNPISYRINGGSVVNVGASNVTLNDTQFPNAGTTANTLEYWYTSTPSVIRTRTIYKNPTHPSLAESHGHFVWGDQTKLNELIARRNVAPYATAYNRMKTNADLHKRAGWKQFGRSGHRSPWMSSVALFPAETSPAFGNSAAINGVVGLFEGTLGTIISGDTLSLGDYVKQMVMGFTWARLDPIKFFGNQASGPNPAPEILGAGYYKSDMIWDTILAYDILAGHYRSDQFPRGLTPIEDYYARDALMSFVYIMNYMIGIGRGVVLGLWSYPRGAAAHVAAMCLKEYSTHYYGTSGYGSVQTTWPDHPATRWTMKVLYGSTRYNTPSSQSGNYPGSTIGIWNPEDPELWKPNGIWDGPIGYFSSLRRDLGLHAYFRAKYDPDAFYPIIQQALYNATNGVLTTTNSKPENSGNFYFAIPGIGNLTMGDLGVLVVQQAKVSYERNGSTLGEALIINNGQLTDPFAWMLHDVNIAGTPITAPPSFSTNPQSAVRAVGENVSFTVSAAGVPSPTLQWRKNGANISGQTGNTLTLTNLQTTDSGTYDCVATNSQGTATSNQAILTVNPPAGSAPAITLNPSSLVLTEGSQAIFTVTATGTPAPTYQWRKNGANISGATSATYSIAAVVAADAGEYDVVVTNVNGSATSSSALLTVNAITPPAPQGYFLPAVTATRKLRGYF